MKIKINNMKYCTIDNIKLEYRVLCVVDDNLFEDHDCRHLIQLKSNGKNHSDCEYYVEYDETNFISTLTTEKLCSGLSKLDAEYLIKFLKD